MSSLSSSNSPSQRPNHSTAPFLALKVKLLVIESQVHHQTWTLKFSKARVSHQYNGYSKY